MRAHKLPISVIVLTFNEQANIDSCLKTIAQWAGEIIVVDSGSTDHTLELARKYTDKVYFHPFENYSRQRNWAQSNCSLANEWVFHIDADERVTPDLAEGLRRIFSSDTLSGSVVGILVRRLIVFSGRPIIHGGLYPTYHCRVFRKHSGRCEMREYDQHFHVEGETIRLEADLLEMTASSFFSWTTRHNRWAQMEAKQLLAGSPQSSDGMVRAKLGGSPIEQRRWWRSRVYERCPLFLRAFLYFSSRYFLRGGFRDGVPGLIYHVLQGFWFRFYVDACYYEMLQNQLPVEKQQTPDDSPFELPFRSGH